MRKWAAASVIALLAILALPLAAGATGGGTGGSSAGCPFPGGEGVVVEISDQLMLAWQADRAMAGPVAVTLPAGSYLVELVSYDDHSNKSHQAQLREQWYLEGWDAAGGVVFRTDATADLPENVDIKTFAVGIVEATSEVVGVKAFHAAYPDPHEPHSVAPLCARFTPGAGSSTSVVAEPTTPDTTDTTAAGTTDTTGATTATTSGGTTATSSATTDTTGGGTTDTTSGATTETTGGTTATTGAATGPPDTSASSTDNGGGGESSLTTETVLAQGLEGNTAQSLQQLPLTGIELETAFVAIVVLMLGVSLVRRARSWQDRLDRRAARIWRRPGT